MKAYLLEDGTYIRTQQEAFASNQTYSKIEIPTSQPELIDFLNNLKPQPEEQKKEEEQITLSEKDKFLIDFRQKVLEGNVNLEEEIWKAPLDVTMKVASIVFERIKEHYNG